MGSPLTRSPHDDEPTRPPASAATLDLWPLSVLFWAAVLAVAFQGASAVAPRHGLRGTYFDNATWSGAVRLARIDEMLTPELLGAHPLGQWQVYSAVWTGTITAPVPGTYTFATISDDGSDLEIDGRAVLDNLGTHRAQRRTGKIDLTAGPHDIKVRYFQNGGRFVLHLLWARGDGTLRPVPAAALWPETPGWPSRLGVLWQGLVGLSVLAAGAVVFVPFRRRAVALAASRVGAALDRIWVVAAQPRVALAVILGVGAAVRLALLASSPAILWPDSHVFYFTVRDILGGRYFAHDPYRTVLYPYYLATFLAWGKTPFQGTLIVAGQQAMGLATALLFYAVGRRALSPRVALAGALLFACHSVQLFYELSIMTEVLFTLDLAGVLWLTQWHRDAPSTRRAVVLGIALGVLVLVRPVAQGFVVCVALVMMMTGRTRQVVAQAAVMAVVSGVVVVPMMAANQHEFGFWGVSLGRGMGLYTRVFDIDEADPPDPSAYPEMQGLWRFSQEQRWSPNRVRDELNFAYRHPSARADDMMFSFALESVRAHPAAFVWNSLRQWAVQIALPLNSLRTCASPSGQYLCSGRAEGESQPPFPNAPDGIARALRVWVVRAMTHGAVLMPAVIGCALFGVVALLVSRDRSTGVVLIVLTVAYFTLVPAVTQFPQDRYRLPVDALLFMLAANGVRFVAMHAAAIGQNPRTR